MTPHYQDDLVTLYAGDCLDVLRDLPDGSVDAVVTDPPYELGFMGKGWDASGIAYNVDLWRDVLRVLKPGGHLLAFGGTRTWHRLACAIEDAGFEVRDSIAWMYGSGFPKSLDVSKAIDRAAGACRTLTRPGVVQRGGLGEDWDTGSSDSRPRYDIPATDAARQWQGWGTALKPAHEPIVVARKPLTGTVAANVLEHGTGALNIDGCRIGTEAVQVNTYDGRGPFGDSQIGQDYGSKVVAGRWPANVVLDEHQAAELDRQSGTSTSPTRVTRGLDLNPSSYGLRTTREVAECYGDTGGASRFFYTAKAGTDERPRVDGIAHPTVKPVDLMRWLVRLVTPPGGTVLEPFAGSGTTAEACVVEGFHCIAIEREADYLPLIVQRLSRPIQPTLDLGA